MVPVEDLLAGLPARISHLLWRREERSPEAPALCHGSLVWSFRQLADAVRETRALLVELGFRPGDRLMVVNENCLALCVLILAAADLDVWVAIINARLSAREVDTIRDHCGARRVFYTAEVSRDAAGHAERHRAQVQSLPHLGRIAIGTLNEGAVPEPVESSGADQVAALIYTSGTTGTPKGVMLTHRNIMFIGAVSSGIRGLAPDDRVYGVLPMSHVYGLSSVFVGTLYAGACLHVVAKFSPDTVLADLRSGITVLQGVPAMFAKLLEHVKAAGARVEAPSLRLIAGGGSPLDPVIKAETEALFGLPLHNGYGLTEASPTIAQTRLHQPRKDCSVGLVMPGVEIRILGQDSRSVPQGEVGELWARGPGIMKGYYRAPEMTVRVIDAEGWLNTGDFAREGADGSLFIVGRSKELIIRSGFNVYPNEVEAVLNAFPGITQSAVVGRPAAEGNEEVVAFVQAAPGAIIDSQELSSFVTAQLAPYKRPAEIVVMEHLPAGATGKILKNRLAEMARQHIVQDMTK
ncbi:MAG: AMP-binding protein [Magnetospirillum sp.]|nr:AMP-binding protein [Magnetospirillum sp.]